MLREVCGRGWEHVVYFSSRTKQRKDKQQWVFKHPKRSVLLLTRALGYNSAKKVKEEIQQGDSYISSKKTSDVEIPQTRVFDTGKMGFKKGYILAQRFVKDDKSVSDVRSKLKQEQLNHLVDIYDVSPQNIMSNRGKLYWVDPSHGYHRIFDRFGGAYYFYLACKAKVFQVVTSFKHIISRKKS